MTHFNSFDFMHNISSVKNMTSNVLSKKCQHLQKILTKETQSDIDGNELCEELKTITISTLVGKNYLPTEYDDQI